MRKTCWRVPSVGANLTSPPWHFILSSICDKLLKANVINQTPFSVLRLMWTSIRVLHKIKYWQFLTTAGCNRRGFYNTYTQQKNWKVKNYQISIPLFISMLLHTLTHFRKLLHTFANFCTLSQTIAHFLDLFLNVVYFCALLHC